MALDRDMFILRIVESSSNLDTASRNASSMPGGRVPQFRQRLILWPQGKIKFTWPPEVRQKSPYGTPLAILPEVEGGWRPEGGAGGLVRITAVRSPNSNAKCVLQ